MKTRNLVKGYLWQRWKNIPNYEGHYRCSSLGKVKGLKRLVLSKNNSLRICPEKFLSQAQRNGYLAVVLCRLGVMNIINTHQVMAITFLKHVTCGNTMVVNHKDGNKKRNYLSNIEIVTNRENASTCYRKNKYRLTSQFVGVSLDRCSGKWKSQIQFKSKGTHLGLFKTELEASNAYQIALLKLTQ